MGRPIMSSFHALFSLGGLTGSGLAAASMAVGVDSLAHLTPIAVLGFMASLTASRGLLPPAPPHTRQKRPLRWPPASLLGLGTLAFAVLLCEGAAADWNASTYATIWGRGRSMRSRDSPPSRWRWPRAGCAEIDWFCVSVRSPSSEAAPVLAAVGLGVALLIGRAGRGRGVCLSGAGMLERRASAIQRGGADAGRRADAGFGGRNGDGLHGVIGRPAPDRLSRPGRFPPDGPRVARIQQRADRRVRRDGSR